MREVAGRLPLAHVRQSAQDSADRSAPPPSQAPRRRSRHGRWNEQQASRHDGLQLGQVGGGEVPRQQPPAVVRHGMRPRDHAGPAWGWDGEPCHGSAVRPVMEGGSLRWGQRRAVIVQGVQAGRSVVSDRIGKASGDAALSAAARASCTATRPGRR